MESDTVFAPITAPGGSINVVRISGILVSKVIDYLGLGVVKHRYVYLCQIMDHGTGTLIDSNALVTFFRQPYSFTGEDVLEISVHGGGFILHRLYDILTKLGCRFALPGEFTKRALFNGKVDLLQAEGINLLVRAETQKQHAIASSFVDGVTTQIYDQWRHDIIHMMALLEASIDFPEEGDVGDSLQRVMTMCHAMHIAVMAYIHKSVMHESIMDGIRVAIIGEPNVGKSSIMNLLSKKEAAIVSNIPGTTRDVIEATLSLHGYLVTFVDTAGLRETDSAIELEGIRRSKLQMQSSDLNLLVVDAQALVPAFVPQCRAQDILVVNKIDLLSRDQLRRLKKSCLQQATGLSVAYVSTLSSDSFAELINLIVATLEAQSPDTNAIAVNERHRNLLSQMSTSLQSAICTNELEIIAEFLRQAVYSLDHIVGKIVIDDILDVIFSKFCIGK